MLEMSNRFGSKTTLEIGRREMATPVNTCRLSSAQSIMLETAAARMCSVWVSIGNAGRGLTRASSGRRFAALAPPLMRPVRRQRNMMRR